MDFPSVTSLTSARWSSSRAFLLRYSQARRTRRLRCFRTAGRADARATYDQRECSPTSAKVNERPSSACGQSVRSGWERRLSGAAARTTKAFGQPGQRRGDGKLTASLALGAELISSHALEVVVDEK